MTRWLVNFLSAVSLLLLAAVLVLWARGYWATDHFWLIYRDGSGELLRSSRGRLTVRHVVPNVRWFPVPRRVSHWACAPGSQLPPKPSPRHEEWGPFAYEGTPAPTRQELAAARLALKEVADVRSGAAKPRPEFSQAPALNPYDPASVRQYRIWLTDPQRYTGVDRLRLKEDQAREVLDGSYYHEWTFSAWLAAAVMFVLPWLNFVVPRHRRRLRRQRGQCVACGYDVRASKQQCPECGAALA